MQSCYLAQMKAAIARDDLISLNRVCLGLSPRNIRRHKGGTLSGWRPLSASQARQRLHGWHPNQSPLTNHFSLLTFRSHRLVVDP
jgi:hypothetical protein